MLVTLYSSQKQQTLLNMKNRSTSPPPYKFFDNTVLCIVIVAQDYFTCNSTVSKFVFKHWWEQRSPITFQQPLYIMYHFFWVVFINKRVGRVLKVLGSRSKCLGFESSFCHPCGNKLNNQTMLRALVGYPLYTTFALMGLKLNYSIISIQRHEWLATEANCQFKPHDKIKGILFLHKGTWLILELNGKLTGNAEQHYPLYKFTNCKANNTGWVV